MNQMVSLFVGVDRERVLSSKAATQAPLVTAKDLRAQCEATSDSSSVFQSNKFTLCPLHEF